MASRQFGCIVFRAVALFFFATALSQSYVIFSLYFVQMELVTKQESLWHKVSFLAILVIQLLVATFLWTNAEKLSGAEDDTKATIMGGNWVVRLVFTTLGILMCTYSFAGVVRSTMSLLSPSLLHESRTPETIIYFITELIKFMVGVYLIITYRFDKAAAFEAAQATEPPMED